MERHLPPLPVRIVVVLIILGTIAYFGFRSFNTPKDQQLKASGTIESVTVKVSPEMAGKVKEVLVDEGQSVRIGDPLLNLDDSLLTAQRVVAAAALDSANTSLASAQTKYDQTLQSALVSQASQRATDWRSSAPTEFNQPSWYFIQSEQVDSAQAEVDAAQKALDDALANLDKVTSDVSNAGYVKAEKRLVDARATFLVLDDVKVQAEYAAESGGLLDAAYDTYNEALDELNAAQSEYNSMLNSKSANEIRDARGVVVIAQQRYDAAYMHLLSLQTGADSPAVVSAQKALDQAKTAVMQAQASLDLLDAQISKLTVYAPMDGVILTRNAEPGEFVQPGSTALTMANLNELTITVYVPEDRYGQIKLGQEASVTVDSFPGQTFNAQVIFIADQAEFTPRNVQTVEGRSSTVYAIKLKVTDNDAKLKIGMPADVTFK